jgi:hypothetical protein
MAKPKPMKRKKPKKKNLPVPPEPLARVMPSSSVRRSYLLTNLGNAERFVENHINDIRYRWGDNQRYSPNNWYLRDGKRCKHNKLIS